MGKNYYTYIGSVLFSTIFYSSIPVFAEDISKIDNVAVVIPLNQTNNVTDVVPSNQTNNPTLGAQLIQPSNNSTVIPFRQPINIESGCLKSQEQINKIYLELIEKDLKTSESILGGIQWFYVCLGGIISLVVGFLGFIGFKVIFPRMVNRHVQKLLVENKDLQDVRKANIESVRELNFVMAQGYKSEGASIWERNLGRAIELTERAVELVKKCLVVNDRLSKEESINCGFIYGNLSYYYAVKGDFTKYDEALSYARVALSTGKKYHILDLIEDFIFVVKQYDIKDRKIVRIACKEFFLYKDEFIKFKIISVEELQDYEEYYKQKKEEV